MLLFAIISNLLWIHVRGADDSAGASSDDVRAEVGASVSLPCRVDTAQCGELHSVKWYRDNQRVYVFSHVASIRRPEGDGSDRMEVEYTPNSSVSRLHIKDVAVTDEALYKCEKTYLEVRENCDVVQVIKLRTLVKPQSVRILSRDGSALGNATILGPYNEGTDIELECEAAGAKPVPQVTWYNGSTIINGAYSSEEGSHGVGTARSKLRITLQRGDLNVEFRCMVESDALDSPIVSWLKADVSVTPTGLQLTGVKSHVVQGSNVLLTCKVFGARPAANVTWYNGTEAISPEMITTSSVLTSNGTYMTESELIFAASRYENGQTLTCEAENAVLRDQNEKPLHERLKLEVLYPPIVSLNSGNITVNESQEVLIICNYFANPAQLDWVKWHRNGQLIMLNDEHYEGGTVTKQSLIIKNATREDMGEYQCTLKNSVGSQESWNTANVNVFYKPIVELKMEPSNIVKAVDKINVTLLCDVASGNPDTLVEVQWYLGGELLKELPDENCTNNINNDGLFCDLDPSRLLLMYVTQDFAGNFSCRGMNDAGWGPMSDEMELIVYYPPSQALVRYEPAEVIKHATVTLYCSVEQTGRPEDTRYMWFRGSHVVRNVTTAKWTISPVAFETNSSFTCIAYNDGGQGPPGAVTIEVLAPPAFIVPLQPYTGAIMNASSIKLMCRVECLPMCSITWLKDGHEIEIPNSRYYVNNTRHPSDKNRYDFESIQSILHFNMSAWPNGQLDRIHDNANYTCRSSANRVGQPVKSTTLFGVEYAPENISVSSKVISVTEHQNPQRVTCSAKGAPEVSYNWYRNTNMQEPVTKGNKLSLTGVTRSSAGHYICKASNRHGNITEKTYLNVMYKPECVITQTELHGSPALVCTAHANPREVTFTWRVKGMNETPEDMRFIEQQGLQSYLILDSSVDTFRTYVCYANNTVDISVPCERDVAGTIAWWKRLDNENLLIIIAIIVGIIVCVIIVCIIIIIVCRRKRASNKFPNQSNTADKNGNPGGTASDPRADPEDKSFYENLPFHGMQNPPNKPMSIITPYVQETSLQNSASNVNISTKSLVHNTKNPLSSPIIYPTNKIQRNQSFAGFQLSSRITELNPGMTYGQIPQHNLNSYPSHRCNLPLLHNRNLMWTNQTYGSNEFNGNQTIGPLILAPNPARFSQNRISSVSNLSTTNRNFNFNPFNSPLSGQIATQMPVQPQQNKLVLTPQQKNHSSIMYSSAVKLNSAKSDSKINEISGCTLRDRKTVHSGDKATLKTGVIPKKHVTKCAKKFGSLEHRKQKCNSPMFYSVRCRKHGKKRTIFELYTLPIKQKTSSTTCTTKPSNSSETPSVSGAKTNCVVVSEIPKKLKENGASAETDEALYQNLTDSIQILEQNTENNIYEIIQTRPKPAPRCKKSPNGIYQNIAFVLKVTPEKNQNECNTLKEDLRKKDDDKSTNADNSNPSEETRNEAESEIDHSSKSIANSVPFTGRSPNLKPNSEASNISLHADKKITKPANAASLLELSPTKPAVNVPILPKTDVKRPTPVKSKDFSNPALIPKMPILKTHAKWSSKPMTHNKNPFYTLTTPQLTSSHQQYSTDQLYSSTFPHQRQTKLVPRALFPEQQISKSKSFSSKSKQKKHFQIPLQKCHSFKFQTAESYFQPIKNIHEENLMRNGYQSDFGPACPRDGPLKRDKHKGNATTTRRSSDTQKYRENLQFHENIQNSVQLQYPQPLYAQTSAGGNVKKNGVVYADLDMDSKTDKKRNFDEKRSPKNKTEYATLKFNEVGQEIDV